MRHRAMVSTFGRKSGPRAAMLKSLVSHLVTHGRITTTLAKAKELKRHVEKSVTVAKGGGSQHSHRILTSRFSSTSVASGLVAVGSRFADRAGGYTRLIRVANRAGDNAEMAIIEFVDYKPEMNDVTVASVDANLEAAIAKRKRVRKLQKSARRVRARNA